MNGKRNIPRLFDTSDLGDSSNFGLGSPNARCDPPGPGR